MIGIKIFQIHKRSITPLKTFNGPPPPHVEKNGFFEIMIPIRSCLKFLEFNDFFDFLKTRSIRMNQFRHSNQITDLAHRNKTYLTTPTSDESNSKFRN